MVRIFKAALFLIALCLLCSVGYGQSTVITQGSEQTLANQYGGLGANKWLRLPLKNNPTTTTRKHGFACIDFVNGLPVISLWDTVTNAWLPIISDTGFTPVTPTLQEVTDAGNVTTTNTHFDSRVTADFVNAGDTVWNFDRNATFFNTRKSFDPTGTFTRAGMVVNRVGFGAAATNNILHGLEVSLSIDSANRKDMTQIGVHPMGKSISANVSATNAQGSIPWAAGLSSTISGSGTFTYHKTTLCDLSYGSLVCDDMVGVEISDVDRNNQNSVAIFNKNGDLTTQPAGEFFIVDLVGNPSQFGGVINYQTALSLGALSLIYKQAADSLYAPISAGTNYWGVLGNGITQGNFLGTTNNADVVIRSNNIEVLTIDTLERVGIGTRTPRVIFDVVDDVNSAMAQNIDNPNAGTAASENLVLRETATSQLRIQHANTGLTSASTIVQPNSGILYTGTDDANGLRFGTQNTSAPILFANGILSSAEIMRMQGGEMRIKGTTTDLGDAVLQVTGKTLSTDIDDYTANLGSTYTARTKTDKNYVDSSTNTKLGTSAISGTNNQIVKFSSTSTIGNSNISDNGTTVTSAVPITVSRNANSVATVSVTNTTNGTGAGTGIFLGNNASNNSAQVFKVASGYSTYKNITGSDFGIYNSTGGDMVFLNDVASGSIEFASGGAAASQLTIASTGAITATSTITSTQFRLSALNTAPATAASAGTTGEIRYATDGYLYVCTATNTWIRVQLSTW